MLSLSVYSQAVPEEIWYTLSILSKSLSVDTEDQDKPISISEVL